MCSYTHAAPYSTGTLPVSTLYTLHYEQYGKQDGKPVLFLHGGPGASTSASDAAYFNPAVYRVVLHDQRGAGKSTPRCELRENTTRHLLSDIEALRVHLGVAKWQLVFGGSWGSTLALLYAQAHPDRVASLVLRGVFLVRGSELAWGSPVRSSGAAQLFPEAAEEFREYLGRAAPGYEESDRSWEDMVYALLTSSDRSVRAPAARA